MATAIIVGPDGTSTTRETTAAEDSAADARRAKAAAMVASATKRAANLQALRDMAPTFVTYAKNTANPAFNRKVAAALARLILEEGFEE